MDYRLLKLIAIQTKARWRQWRYLRAIWGVNSINSVED